VYIKVVLSFLNDRKFYVTHAGERSAECGVPSGVPQGAVLSRTLFNIFTSYFPTLTDGSLPVTWHYLVHILLLLLLSSLFSLAISFNNSCYFYI
jgi:hypothetical protein